MIASSQDFCSLGKIRIFGQELRILVAFGLSNIPLKEGLPASNCQDKIIVTRFTLAMLCVGHCIRWCFKECMFMQILSSVRSCNWQLWHSSRVPLFVVEQHLDVAELLFSFQYSYALALLQISKGRHKNTKTKLCRWNPVAYQFFWLNNTQSSRCRIDCKRVCQERNTKVAKNYCRHLSVQANAMYPRGMVNGSWLPNKMISVIANWISMVIMPISLQTQILQRNIGQQCARSVVSVITRVANDMVVKLSATQFP